jgi:hypothetical protein
VVAHQALASLIARMGAAIVRRFGRGSVPIQVDETSPGDEQQGGGVDADTMQSEQRRGSRFVQLGELAVEAGAVGVDVEYTAIDGLHRQLGGVDDL